MQADGIDPSWKRMLAPLAEVSGWVWVALAVALVLIAVEIAYVGGVSAPVVDYWQYTDPDDYLANAFVRHNGHPILVNKIALALDYWWFEGSGDVLRVAILFVKAGQAVALIALCRLAGVSSRRDLMIMGAAAFIISFNPVPHINFREQFQFSFVVAFAATVGGIAALALYAAKQRIWVLVLAAALSLIATQSVISGILAPLLLLMMSIRLGLPRTVSALFVIILALGILSIVATPGAGARLRLGAIDLNYVGHVIGTLGSGVGSLIYLVLAPMEQAVAWTNQANIAFGIILLICAAAPLWRVATLQRVPPAEVTAAALVLLAVGSSAMMALRTAANGYDHVPSRYAEGGVMMLCAVLATLAVVMPKLGAFARSGLMIAGIAGAACCVAGGLGAVRIDQDEQVERVLASTAHVLDIRRNKALFQLARQPFHVDLAYEVRPALRESGKMHFADPWARAYGDRLVAPRPEERCNGRITIRPSRFGGYLRIGGTVSADLAREGSSVVVFRGTRVAGYGRVPRRWDDFLSGFIERDPLEMVGYVRVRRGDERRYIAYLADREGLICRFRATR